MGRFGRLTGRPWQIICFHSDEGYGNASEGMGLMDARSEDEISASSISPEPKSFTEYIDRLVEQIDARSPTRRCSGRSGRSGDRAGDGSPPVGR